MTIEEQVVTTLRTLPTAGQYEVLEFIRRLRHCSQQEERGTGSTALNWPPGLYESTAGAWQGEPLVREYEGEIEQRNELS